MAISWFRSEAKDPAWILFLTGCLVVPLLTGNVGTRLTGYRPITLDVFTLPKFGLALLLFGVALALQLVKVVRGVAPWRHSRFIWAVTALAGWAIVCGLNARSLPVAVFGYWSRNEGIFAYMLYAAAFVVAMQLVTDTPRMRVWAWTTVAAGSLVAAYGLLQFAGLDPMSWPAFSFGSRIISTFGNPDLVATFMTLPLVLSVGLALDSTSTRVERRVALAASSLLAISAVLSLIRGVWLGVGVGLVLLVLIAVRSAADKAQWLKRVWPLPLAVTLAVAVSILRPQSGLNASERIASLIASPASGSVGSRLYLWQLALRLVQRSPVFGWGPDGFAQGFLQVANAKWWSTMGTSLIGDNAHNIILQSAATLGVPGAVLYAGILVAVLVITAPIAFHRAARQDLLLAALWSGLVSLTIVFLAGLTTPIVVVWLWIAAGVLIAPSAWNSQPVTDAWRVAAASAALVAIVLAVTGASWLAADIYAGTGDRQRDPEAAALLLDKAIRINPFADIYWFDRGAVYEVQLAKSRRPSEAEHLEIQTISAYRKAVKHDSWDVESSVRLLSALNQWNELRASTRTDSEAVQLAARLSVRWPSVPEILNESARAYLHFGNAAEAEKLAERSIESAPNFTRGRLTLARTLVAQGKNSAARSQLDEVLRLDPANTEARQLQNELTGASQ